MELLQTFETTVSDDNGTLALAFLVVPLRSMNVHNPSAKPQDVHSALRLKAADRVTPASLPIALASLLVAEKGKHNGLEIFRQAESEAPPPQVREMVTVALPFAERVCSLELVPFSESPLQAVALSKLLEKGGTAVGVWAGWVLAAGHPPLLLLTLPAGIIICGAAEGVALGLKDFFRKRVSSWLEGKVRRSRSVFNPRHSTSETSSHYLGGGDLPVGIEKWEGWEDSAREIGKPNKGGSKPVGMKKVVNHRKKH